MKTAAKLIGLLIHGLCAGWASAQAGVISGQTVNQYGVPAPYSSVRVCSVTSTGTPCTPTATVYYDYALTMPVAQPYQSDQYGNYTIYVPALAAPNLYVVQLTPTSGVTWSYVFNGPYCSLSGCTFSGPINATYFNATTSPYYEVNGVQLASTNLLDTANIAYKNASNTFTGSIQTAPTWNATTGFTVNGTALACVNLSDCANLAKINASNTFTGATNTFNALVGTTINATTGYKYAGAAPSNHVLLGNGANYVDSATIPYSVIAPGGASGPFAAAGIPYATSTTASTVATSPQLVAALNNTPSTTLAPALLPLATISSFGAVEPDNSTIGITAGVISVKNGSTTTITQHDLTGSRAFTTVYQNTNPGPIWIEFSAQTIGGPAAGTAVFNTGATSGGLAAIGQTSTVAVSTGETSTMSTWMVQPGWYYEVTFSGSISIFKWIEVY